MPVCLRPLPPASAAAGCRGLPCAKQASPRRAAVPRRNAVPQWHAVRASPCPAALPQCHTVPASPRQAPCPPPPETGCAGAASPGCRPLPSAARGVSHPAASRAAPHGRPPPTPAPGRCTAASDSGCCGGAATGRPGPLARPALWLPPPRAVRRRPAEPQAQQCPLGPAISRSSVVFTGNRFS